MSDFDKLIEAREKRIIPSWRIQITLVIVWTCGWAGALLSLRVGWWWTIIPAVAAAASAQLLLGKFRRTR